MEPNIQKIILNDKTKKKTRLKKKTNSSESLKSRLIF